MTQGREAKHYIQAPTEDQLDEMIEGLNEYAMDHGMDSIEVLQKRPDPDGGWEATVTSHNFNFGTAIKWVKEKFRPTREFDIESGELRDVEPEEEDMRPEEDPRPRPRGEGPSGFARRLWEKHKRETEEEKAFEERRRRGEVSPEELSPREMREQVKTARRISEEAAKAAGRARKEERKAAPGIARKAMEAKEMARAAEERAKLLETQLYGAPHEQPEEVIRDRWGREIGRRPLTAQRREEAAKLELAQRRITEKGISLTEERFRAAEEAIRERRIAKRRGKILGPAREVAKGIAGVVESVGRTGAGFGVRTSPYRMKPPALIPTMRPTPRPRQTMGPIPQPPDLSALRRLQTQSTGLPKVSFFPAKRPPTKQKPRGRNTYNDSMRRMRRNLFGG